MPHSPLRGLSCVPSAALPPVAPCDLAADLLETGQFTFVDVDVGVDDFEPPPLSDALSDFFDNDLPPLSAGARMFSDDERLDIDIDAGVWGDAAGVFWEAPEAA
jgi:hypothetical protein